MVPTTRARTGAWRAAFALCGLVVLAVAGTPIGCGGQTSASNASDASAAPPSVSTSTSAPGLPPTVDIEGTIRRVHFAYRKDGAAWSGGHATYAVRVDEEGTVVTPFRRSSTASPDDDAVAAAPIVLGRATLVRDGRRIDDGQQDVAIADDGHLTVRRGATVVEELRNDDEGVEQSWVVSERPMGAHDLVVRVPVSGLRFTGATASGLHFVDDRTGVGVRYGHGTWVDAKGTRTPVIARWEGGAITLSVPAASVDDAVYPAVLDPAVSPEFGVDNPVEGPASTVEPTTTPSVAFDGTNYLVVFRDKRSSTPGAYAIRVSPAGTVLDKGGIYIGPTTSAPAVGFDGTNYLVAWSEVRTGGAGSDIYFTRMSPSGLRLEVSGKLLALAAFEQTEPAVAHDGTNFFVAWTDGRASNKDIYGARVSAAGDVLDPAGIPISVGLGDQQRPAIAFDGTNYFVVYQDGNISGIRVAPSGSLIDAAPKTICNAANPQTDPKVVFDGINYLVTWRDERDSGGAIYAMRVNIAGTLLDAANGFMVAGAGFTKGSPSLGFDGTNYLVVWSERRIDGTGAYETDLRGARITKAGTVLELGGVVLNSSVGAQSLPAVSYGAGQYFIAFADTRGSEEWSIYDLYGARVQPSLTLIDPVGFPILMGTNQQNRASVTTDGTNYFVAFSDYRAGTWDIYGVRLGPTGAILDPSGIAIGTAPEPQKSPVAAFDGTQYLVVWADQRNRLAAGSFGTDIYGARVSSAGVVLDSTNIPISKVAKEQNNPDVAWDGANFLVVWDDERTSTSADVYATRVSPAGVVLDSTGIVVSAASGSQRTPAIAFDGTNYLVVWSSDSKVYASRVSPVGLVMDPLGVQLASSSGAQVTPDLAFDGTNYLVVWSQNKGAATSYDIYGTRVSAAAVVLDPTSIAISTATAMQTVPAIAFDGTNYVVVWQDERYSTTSLDVRAARVSPAGVTLDVNGFSVSSAGVSSLLPSITSAGKGRSLVVYHRAAVGVSRVFGRFIDDSLGKACTSGTDCTTGFCVDGVCCDTACGGGDPTDCMACSAALSTGATGICSPAKAGGVCRPAAGACDVAETCNGSSTACPTDTFLPSTTVCRASAGVCDLAEKCTGSSAACPSDAFAASTTICRASAGPCDAVESCTGASAACPDDAFASATTVCRESVGPCDVAETCTGSSAACPANVLASAGTVCRPAAGPCDAEEKCSGASAACPVDTLLPSTAVCRPAAGACDAEERCTGSSVTCPSDAFLPVTTVCRASAGVCDVAESCTGSSAECPSDVFAASTVTCRASAGVCDVAESCTGTSPTCPTDAFEPGTTVCHAPSDACDLEVRCTGSGATCSTGGKVPGCCLTDGDCDDGNPCTTDTCAANTCSHVAIADCDAGPIDAGSDAGTDAADASDASDTAVDDGDTAIDTGADTTPDSASDTAVDDTGAPEPDTGSTGSDTGSTESDTGAPAADASSPATAAEDSGGCGCRTAGSAASAASPFFHLALPALAMARRRRSIRPEARVR